MSPIRILIAGDTHGINQSMLSHINEAGKRNIQHVVVVGDFGLWTHFAEGHDFLEETNEAARINNLSVYAIGGNHENWDHWNWFVENMPTHKGFAMVRRRVLLAPRAHKWTWANKQFVGAGGAVSIDRDWRLAKERENPNKYGPKSLWWPNEEFTDEDVETIQKWARWGAMSGGFDSVDYLLTHDCSNYTMFKNRIKPDPASERHRRRIDEVIKATKAKMQFHGHMHEQYNWENSLSHGDSAFSNEPWTGPVTQTYGLECNSDWNSWGVLDTELNIFRFRGQGMQFRSLED